MGGDGVVVLGPLNDDGYARAHYGLTAKQLRNIRNAATSGGLRRRAAELGVELPFDSSWINQIETWFGIITKQAIRRGTFTSVKGGRRV